MYLVRKLKVLSVPAALTVTVLAVLGGCMVRMPGKSYQGPLPPLAREEEDLSRKLKAHVEKLAVEIGERNVWHYEGLAASARYIEGTLSALGYPVDTPSYRVNDWQVHNIVAEIPGSTRRDEIVIVGAHYDTAPGTQGANDNASGTAALLELARRFAQVKPERTLRFVAFVNEEPPFFQTDLMGSLVYARLCRGRGERIVAMLSLETIGYFSDQKGSQHYPPPVSMFYPGTGNFIAFVGNRDSKDLVRQCVKLFRENAQFPSEGAALAESLTGIGWSDHWSFWKTGYPALMVTDTAPFRYPYYHTPEDTADKLDYDRMARVIKGLAKVVEALANPDQQKH